MVDSWFLLIGLLCRSKSTPAAMPTHALTSEFKILNKKNVAAVKFDLSRRDLGEPCTSELSRSSESAPAICCARLPNGQMFVVDGAQRLRALSRDDQIALFEIVSVENLLSAFDLALARQVSPNIFCLSIDFVLYHFAPWMIRFLGGFVHISTTV